MIMYPSIHNTYITREVTLRLTCLFQVSWICSADAEVLCYNVFTLTRNSMAISTLSFQRRSEQSARCKPIPGRLAREGLHVKVHYKQSRLDYTVDVLYSSFISFSHVVI